MNKNFCGLALGALLFALSFPVQAQQSGIVFRIGFLVPGSASSYSTRIEAFRLALKELGYVEGENIIIEYRYALGKRDRLPVLAAELARLKVNVIVTASTPAIRAAQRATTTIPIVMGAVGDPVQQGFVASLARPGGNITGFTNLSSDLSAKRLELLKEAFPKARRVAVFQNAAQHGPAMKDVVMAARFLGLELQLSEVRGANDLELAFAAVTSGRADALMTLPNSVLSGDLRSRRRIVEFALKSRLPAMYGNVEFVEAGGFMSYTPDILDNFRRAATHVDKILQGTKPTDLPVEQPTKFEFVINLKAAKQIGLTIPPNLLVRANRVIR